MAIPEEYGGAGIEDYRYNVVLQEEAARALVTLGTVRTQLDVILPYFLAYATRAAGALVSRPGPGELLTAIAMTEPAPAPTWPASAPPPCATATLRPQRRQDLYHRRLLADLVIVVARTVDAIPRTGARA